MMLGRVGCSGQAIFFFGNRDTESNQRGSRRCGGDVEVEREKTTNHTDLNRAGLGAVGQLVSYYSEGETA